MSAWLGRHSWIVPLVFAAALAAAGTSALRALEASEREQLRTELETTRRTARAAIEVWVANNESAVEVYLKDPRIRRALTELARVARTAEDPQSALLEAPQQQALREILNPVADIYGFGGWGSQDLSGLMIASRADDQIGFRPKALTDRRQDVIADRFVTHSPPIFYDTPNGQSLLMIVGGPVLDDDAKVIATFGFSLDPTKAFARLLEAARLGETGETYAFDENGVMVSASRFEDELRTIGLLPTDPSTSSALSIEIRDPGGNLFEGHHAELPLRARPFTKAAAAAISGDEGADIDGYNDYRGVPVIGAWTWVPALSVGIASELDVGEAYAGLRTLQQRVSIVLGLLLFATFGMAAYSIVLSRLQGKVDAARQLGRYRLERKLGQGGMGTVYLARHALLRRPTAVKVLEGDAIGKEAATRFEREVQVSSSLSHPNTIEIYDFGHSADGTFYYAMEYVGGITLGTLVEKDGPVSDARARHILLQAAGSLAEAHARGLIHRDIKPANVMLCERGGMLDFVKVLDFGLVRAREQDEDLAITSAHALTGTPLYMAPEALEDPTALGASGDVYQLGAVGYYLLAGRPPFEGSSVVEVLSKHLKVRPQPPGEVAGREISPDLEAILLRCLSKDPGDRFEDAGALRAALESATVEGDWSQDDAHRWWENWTSIHGEDSEEPVSSSGSSPSGYTIDLVDRLRTSNR